MNHSGIWWGGVTGPGILIDWQVALYSLSPWRICGAKMVKGQNDASEGLVYTTNGLEFLLEGDGIQ